MMHLSALLRISAPPIRPGESRMSGSELIPGPNRTDRRFSTSCGRTLDGYPTTRRDVYRAKRFRPRQSTFGPIISILRVYDRRPLVK